MSEILLIKSLDDHQLLNEIVHSWCDPNEKFIVQKKFSYDGLSVEITFVDEERADIMQDLLNSCYGNRISAIKPETHNKLETSHIQEERELSPVHMSSALSVCSKRSGFSTRLTKFDCITTLKDESEKIPLAVGRGRSLPFRFLPDDFSPRRYEDEDEASTVISDRSSPVSSITGKDLSPPIIQ